MKCDVACGFEKEQQLCFWNVQCNTCICSFFVKKSDTYCSADNLRHYAHCSAHAFIVSPVISRAVPGGRRCLASGTLARHGQASGEELVEIDNDFEQLPEHGLPRMREYLYWACI